MKCVIFVNHSVQFQKYQSGSTSQNRKIYVYKNSDPKSAEPFIREFVRVWGGIFRAHSSREWRATDLVSKNRFMSRASVLIQEYLALHDAIVSSPCDELVVSNYSPSVFEQLKLNLPKEEYACRSLDGLTYFKLKAAGRAVKTRLKLIKNAVTVGARALAAKMTLRGRIQEKENGPWYVLKTFIYDSSFREKYTDAFFGRLPEYLKQNDKHVLIFANISRITGGRRCRRMRVRA